MKWKNVKNKILENFANTCDYWQDQDQEQDEEKYKKIYNDFEKVVNSISNEDDLVNLIDYEEFDNIIRGISLSINFEEKE